MKKTSPRTAATLRNLKFAHRHQRDDDRVHLNLRDGTTRTGILRAVTADAIYLDAPGRVAVSDIVPT